MNIIEIENTIFEAKKFIARAEKAKAELELFGWQNYMIGTSKSGSLKRQSMELTRALVDLRKT